MKSSIRIFLLVLLSSSSLLLLVGPGTGRAQPLQPHAPIFIPTDSDFSLANGVTPGGNGLPGNPYIIENWEITANTTTGIHITNTQSFFIIRNVFIHPSGFTPESMGIVLSNAINGRVENVRIANFAYALWLHGSQDTITTSTMWNNTYGIVLKTGSRNVISYNNLYNNTRYGVWADDSTAGRFTGNNASYNGNGPCENVASPCDGEGFVVASGSSNIFENNTADRNFYYGFRSVGSKNNIFRNNNASKNQYGLIFTGSSGNQAYGNSVINNNYGIGLEVLDTNNNLTLNRVINNEFGIYVYNSSRNVIYNNYLQNFVNTSEDNKMNAWNVTKTLAPNILGGPFRGGNYYSDYQGSDSDGDGMGDTPYLTGRRPGYQNQDMLPLVQAQPTILHDIAVKSVTAQPSSGRVGASFNLTVAVFNQGTVPESFLVTVSYDQTIINYTPVSNSLAAWSGRTFSISWDTTGLSPGTYTIRANATIVAGETYTSNNISPPTSVNLALNQAPTAQFSINPANILAGTTVTLDGSSSFDVDGTIASYSWNFGDGSTGSGATASHTYSNAGTFTLSLRVTDNDGATSSSTTRVITVASNRPSPPENLRITAKYGTATLTWSPPSSTGGSAIMGYKIYRGTSPSQLNFLASIGDQTSYNDNTVSNGQTYYYQVTAVNSAGMEGERSSGEDILVPGSATANLPGNPQVWLSGIAAAILAGVAFAALVIRRRRNDRPVAV